MAKTATVHNPTNFEPKDYTVVDYLDNKRPVYYGEGIEAYTATVQQWEGDMARALGTDWRAKMHKCVHCGNGTVRWITATRHIPTNDVVVFGAVCTHRLGFEDKHSFKLAQLQARAEARQVRFTIWNARQEFLAKNPEFAAAIAKIDEPQHARNLFANDVIGKLNLYGSLSEKQVAAVTASLRRDDEFAANFAARKAAEAVEVKGDAPTGRVEVTGTVVTMKQKDTDFGVVTKMMVKLANNSRVWVTAPADVERNDTITFKATFTVSKDDKSFAFGSRPHLVSRKGA